MTAQTIRFLAILLTSILLVVPTSGMCAEKPALGQPVYFLGVDTAPAQARMSNNFQAAFVGNDRWGFTDFARETLQEMDVADVRHDFGNWRPLDDPFSVAVIVLKSLNVTSQSLGTIGYREYVTAELAWIHIGQDRLGIGMAQTFPEVRVAIARSTMRTFVGSEPPEEAEMQRLQDSAIRGGIETLAHVVKTYQARTRVRRATEMRYVSVVSAPMEEWASSGINEIYGERAVHMARSISTWVAQHTESLIMDAIYSNSDLDHVIVLPAGDTLNIMSKMWPEYARRIFALSPNSGAKRVLGESPPRIRVVSKVCESATDPRVIEVPGWHIRSALASIESKLTPLSKYVFKHQVEASTVAALRIPMQGTKYLRGIANRPPPAVGSASVGLKQNSKIKLGDQLNDFHLSNLIEQAVSDSLPKMLEQLAELQDQSNDMSEYRNSCNEKV